MKLLVLGGTRFLSREVAAQAVARGWDVTCACRGESGPLPDGVRHLPWDRADDAPAALAEGGWDAVVDAAFLEEHGVPPWAGEGSLPLWLSRPAYDGILAHDPGPAIAAGLRLRPVADTAPGCLDSPVVALTPEREAELLAAWHAR